MFNSLNKAKWGSYKKFLKSLVWADQKKITYKKRGKICTKCKTNKATIIHHTKYLAIWGSYDELKHLTPVCRNCHDKIHKEYKIVSGVLKKKKNNLTD